MDNESKQRLDRIEQQQKAQRGILLGQGITSIGLLLMIFGCVTICGFLYIASR